MKTIASSLLRLSVFCWIFFAGLLAAELGLLPASWRGEGVFFRWQVWLLAGMLLMAAQDCLADLRCRCCGSREDLSPLALFTRAHEILCRRCLRWDPQIEPQAATAPALNPELD